MIQLVVPVYPRAEALPDAPGTRRVRWAWRTLAATPVGPCDDGSNRR